MTFEQVCLKAMTDLGYPEEVQREIMALTRERNPNGDTEIPPGREQQFLAEAQKVAAKWRIKSMRN